MSIESRLAKLGSIVQAQHDAAINHLVDWMEAHSPAWNDACRAGNEVAAGAAMYVMADSFPPHLVSELEATYAQH